MLISRFPSTICYNCYLLSSLVIYQFVKNQLAEGARCYFHIFCAIPLVSISVSVPASYYFSTVGLQYNLRSEIVMPPAFSLFVQDVFAYFKFLLDFVFPFLVKFGLRLCTSYYPNNHLFNLLILVSISLILQLAFCMFKLNFINFFLIFTIYFIAPGLYLDYYCFPRTTE